LFCLTALFQAAHLLIQERERPGAGRVGPYLLSASLVPVFFLLTTFPYINHSKRIYGEYFYNVNSTFYMWYDSWDEVEQGTRVHGDREGWPDMPAELIPGPAKYWREHTAGEIGQRFGNGLLTVLVAVVMSYGYYKYMLIYSIFSLMVILLNWRQSFVWAGKYPVVFLFAGGYFAGYLLLYAWYTPITGGNRFILTLFLPYLFVVSILIRRHYDHFPTLVFGGRRIQFLNVVVLSVLLVDLYFIFTRRIVTMYAGS
jgi:hypothetical protein